MSQKILGVDLLKLICKAIGEEDQFIRRVVLDISLDDAVLVYVEKIGSDKLLEIDWSNKGIKLEIKEVK